MPGNTEETMKLLPNAVFCLGCIMMLVFLFLLLSGCDHQSEAKRQAYKKPHVVKLWSGGEAVMEWRAKYRPQRDSEGSSLMGFIDNETNTYVLLRGTISVEQAE